MMTSSLLFEPQFTSTLKQYTVRTSMQVVSVAAPDRLTSHPIDTEYPTKTRRKTGRQTPGAFVRVFDLGGSAARSVSSSCVLCWRKKAVDVHFRIHLIRVVDHKAIAFVVLRIICIWRSTTSLFFRTCKRSIWILRKFRRLSSENFSFSPHHKSCKQKDHNLVWQANIGKKSHNGSSK